MEKTNKKAIKQDCSCYSKKVHSHHDSGAIYGLGIFGALFYFLQNATTFSLVMIGILKSIFWPAFVLYKVLTILQM